MVVDVLVSVANGKAVLLCQGLANALKGKELKIRSG